MASERVYLSPPDVLGREYELIRDALDSGWVAPLGPHVDAFERELASRVEVAHSAALSSGTAALHLALRMLGVGPGDEVYCPSLTFVASAAPILYLGASPVFIDSDPQTWTLDVNLLEAELKRSAKRNQLPRAVITVDLYGQSADHDSVLALCDGYDVPVVEDAAEALGSKYRGRPVGGFGEFGVFSFNGNKIITTSGGGMLVSSDEASIEQARFLATQARDPAPYYQHSTFGYNYRMSNMCAAIGRAQLETLDARVAARRANFDRYVSLLGDLDALSFMPEAPYGTSNRWLTCVTIDPRLSAGTPELLRQNLEAANVEARPIWKPLHMQPLFANARRVLTGASERIFAQGLCLPSGATLEAEDATRIAAVVRKAMRG